MSKIKPILLSGKDVMGLLDNENLKVIIPVKENPKFIFVGNYSREMLFHSHNGQMIGTVGFGKSCEHWNFGKPPVGLIEDTFWVRETFVEGYSMTDGYFDMDENGDYIEKVSYRADRDLDRWYDGEGDFPSDNIPWKASIHMPKRLCRLFVEIEDIWIDKMDNMCHWVIKLKKVDRPNNFSHG